MKHRYRIKPRRVEHGSLVWLVMPFAPRGVPVKILSVEQTAADAMQLAMFGRPPRAYPPDKPLPAAEFSDGGGRSALHFRKHKKPNPPYPEH